MPAPGEAVFGVDEILRARANARRIKEHYEGTLGVPSELQSLSHLLAHDKEAVFSGLEHLPFYNKSDIPPRPISPPPLEPMPTHQPGRRRQKDQSQSGTLRDRSVSPQRASTSAGAASMPLADPGPMEPGSASAPGPAPEGSGAQLELPPSVPFQQPWPLDPGQSGSGPSSRKLLLPSGLELDPWHWTGSIGAGQGSAAPTPGNTSLRQGRGAESPYRQEGAAAFQRPESRTSTAAGSVAASPSSLRAGGHVPRRTGNRSGSPSGLGPESESDEDRKHRLARQRLLSPNDLSPQDWARIGPPQDAVDLEKFVAREYDVSVDYDRHTLAPKRVARPDIFHISQDEAQRRQIEADQATLALQATRRAEAEAEERRAEEERLARSAARWPKYDVNGVRRLDRNVSPALPRYLDWHPDGVGGIQQQQRQQQSFRPLLSAHRSLSGASGANTGASSTPRMSRCASAARQRSESATAALGYGTGGALRGSTLGDQLLHNRRTDSAIGADPYVYDDMSEDPQDNGAGLGAAYGTRPPRRRHHSAMAGGCSSAPPQRPAGMTDAHYAQIVRQQRKWLNAPAQPPRPVSAAPLPAPLSQHYTRPRSSRPFPEGTAAPIPSRIAATAAALTAAAAAAARPSSALRTIIHQRTMAPPRPSGSRVHSSWGAIPSGPMSTTTGNAWAAAGGQYDGSNDGGGPARPISGTARPGSAQPSAAPPVPHKRLPWEAREHLAGAAAAGIIPHRLSWEGPDSAGPPSASRRRSSTGMSVASATGPGGYGGGYTKQSPRQSAVYGETGALEGAGNGPESYAEF